MQVLPLRQTSAYGLQDSLNVFTELPYRKLEKMSLGTDTV